PRGILTASAVLCLRILFSISESPTSNAPFPHFSRKFPESFGRQPPPDRGSTVTPLST
ncbi:Hypothetical predicted protein, partial [Marmota monax]